MRLFLFVKKMKKIERFVVSAYQTNCYVLYQDQEALIVDPGARAERMIASIDEKQASVSGIVLTHGHLDHIGAVDDLAAHYGCPVYISEADMPLLTNPRLNESAGGREIIIKTKPRAIPYGKASIGSFNVEFIDAPGHTAGCVMMLWNENLFAGDVLFKGSIGRTDLATGSNSQMVNTLNEIKKMSVDYQVFPGHGDATRLFEEFAHNPYLN